MTEDSAVEALHRVNDRSKAVAVLSALAAFAAGYLTTGAIQFVSIAAVAVGIGVRFGSLWLGARLASGTESAALTDQATAGGYHHGAAGFALAAAGVVALLAGALGFDGTVAGGAAVAVALGGYATLSVVLPE